MRVVSLGCDLRRQSAHKIAFHGPARNAVRQLVERI